jgi:sterol 3beta-glucosyltransferase
MRVLIYSFGTQGDVQPYIALAKGLIRAGHEAALCTAEGFRADIEAHGVTYAYMNNDMLRLIQDAMPNMSGPRDTYKIIRAMRPAMRSALDDQWTAAQRLQPSVIVYHPKALGGYHIAEKLGVPSAISLPLPFFTPTREFPIPFIGSWPLGPSANRLSYQFQRFTAVAYGGMLNDFRRTALRLPSIRRTDDLLHDHDGRPLTVLYPFSRHVRPVPADYPPQAHVTGYWFLDHLDDWQPTAELERFLDAGEAPVYIGFGSMGFDKGAGDRRRAIVAAVEREGVRAILATGWSRPIEDQHADHIFVLDAAPHDWLFPRVAAVVHHGGAGTTGAGLRAGRPTLICPVLGDQPFWGTQVHRLGAGPKPLPWRRITAERLSDRVRSLLTSEQYRYNADHIGRGIRSEDGIASAISVLEALHENQHQRSRS